jgi:hypothetical protein
LLRALGTKVASGHAAGRQPRGCGRRQARSRSVTGEAARPVENRE